MLKGQITIDRPGVSTRKQFSIDDIGDVFANRVVEGDLVTLHPGDYTSVTGAVSVPPEVGVVIMPGAIVEYSDDFRLEDFSGDGAYDGPPFNSTNQPLANGAERYLTPEFIGNVENIVDLNLGSEWAFDRQLEQLANDLNFEVIDDGSNDQFTVDISGGSNTLTFATRDALALDFNNSQQKVTIDENVPRGVQSANGLRLIEITGTTPDPNGGWKGDIDVIHKEIRAEVDGERPNPQSRQQPVSRIVNEIVLHQTDRVGTTNPEPDGHVQEVRTADIVGGDDINIFETTNADAPDEIEIDITDNTVSAVTVNDATSKDFLSASISNNTLSISHTGGGSSFDETTSTELVSGVITDEKGHVTTLEAKEIVASTDLDVSFSSSEVTLSHADTGDADFSGSTNSVVNDIQTDGRGHINSIGSANLDDRYYTETEADNRFVNENGDTMTGDLTLNANLSFDTGEVVSNIRPDVRDPGTNNDLVTESGIRSAVDAAASSGVTSIIAGSNIDISPNDGEGDVTVIHANTSSQSNFSAGAGDAITDINVDGDGHVTSISDTDFDTRYVKESGDTMSGSLTINSSIQLNNGTSVNGIDTSVGDPGSDNRLVTEEGIRSAIDSATTGNTFVNGSSYSTSDDTLTLNRSGAFDITQDIEPGAVYHGNGEIAVKVSSSEIDLQDNLGLDIIRATSDPSVSAFNNTNWAETESFLHGLEINDGVVHGTEGASLGLIGRTLANGTADATIVLNPKFSGDIQVGADDYIDMGFNGLTITEKDTGTTTNVNNSTGLRVFTDPDVETQIPKEPPCFVIAKAGYIDFPMRGTGDPPPRPPDGYIRMYALREGSDDAGQINALEPGSNNQGGVVDPG